MNQRARNVTTWERRLVELAVVGTAIGVWRAANDPFSLVKLTILVLAAAGVLLVGLWHVLDTGRLRAPRSAAAYAAAVFVLVGLVAVVSSDATWRSLLGVYGRGAGFLAYAASAVLFLGLVRSVTPETAWRVVRAILVGAGLVALYGVLQRLGADPYEWTTPYGPNAATSTLGNTNFVSGYVGAVLPLAVWATVAHRDRARLLAAGTAVIMALAIVVTRSQQGLVAAGAGVALLALVAADQHGGARRRPLIAGIVLAGVLSGVALAAGLAGTGPLAALNDTGYAYRRHYWSAAVEMATDDPLTGVGFDRWSAHYRAVRSADAAAVGLADTTDEPHSVPLNMFASGGFPLGLAYLAFLAAVGWSLLRGLARADTPSRRLLLGAVGGAWAGYQVQSAVSIDVPPLPALHFVLAGLVVVLAGPVRFTEIVVPPLVRTVERRRGRSATVQHLPRLAGWPAATIAAILAVIGLWQLTRPVMADMDMRGARRFFAAGATDAGFDRMRSALDRWRREAEYISIIGDQFGRDQQPQLALASYERALELEPRRFADVLNAARSAAAAEDYTSAALYYAQARALEPNSLELQIESASTLVQVGNVDEAITILEAALETRPDDANAWTHLGRARVVAGDREGGHDAFREVIALLPPDQASPRLALLTQLKSVGMLDEARTVAEEAIEISRNAETLAALAEIEELEGNIDAAIALYEEASSMTIQDTVYSAEAERLRTEEAQP